MREGVIEERTRKWEEGRRETVKKKGRERGKKKDNDGTKEREGEKKRKNGRRKQ